MAKDNLTTKTEGCPALYDEGECYVLGKECPRKDYEHCPEYIQVVRHRGDAFYRATIQTVTSGKPRQA